MVTALGLSFLSFSSAAAVTAVMNAVVAAVVQTTPTTAVVAAAAAERRKALIKAHILEVRLSCIPARQPCCFC